MIESHVHDSNLVPSNNAFTMSSKQASKQALSLSFEEEMVRWSFGPADSLDKLIDDKQTSKQESKHALFLPMTHR